MLTLSKTFAYFPSKLTSTAMTSTRVSEQETKKGAMRFLAVLDICKEEMMEDVLQTLLACARQSSLGAVFVRGRHPHWARS